MSETKDAENENEKDQKKRKKRIDKSIRIEYYNSVRMKVSAKMKIDELRMVQTANGRMILHVITLFKTGHVIFFCGGLLRYLTGKG